MIEVSCWMVSGERQAARIRWLYLKATLRQDISFFDNQNTNTSGEFTANMSGDSLLIQDAMGEKVFLYILTVGENYVQDNVVNYGNICLYMSGWKIDTTCINIHRRLHGRFYKGLASDASASNISATTCGVGCVDEPFLRKDGIPWTRCLFCSSFSC